MHLKSKNVEKSALKKFASIWMQIAANANPFCLQPQIKSIKISQDHACNFSKEKLTSQKILGLRKKETRYLGQVFKRGGASDTCPSVWRDFAGSLNFGEIRKNFPL